VRGGGGSVGGGAPASRIRQRAPPAPSHAPSRRPPRRRSLHGVHDEAKDKPFELEMAWICAASNWEFAMVPKDVVAAGEAWAKAEIEKEAMGGDDE
jgi:hypothetical protein